MLPKPDACRGCPLYGDGYGFVPDEVLPDGKTVVTVVAQNPGGDEEAGRRVVGFEPGGRTAVYEKCPPAPLVGKTGYEMERSYFPLADLHRGENVSLCNILKCRWIDPETGKRTNKLPGGKLYAEAVEHCTKAHLRLPESKLTVAMGAHAWEYLSGKVGSITDWRGFLAPTGYVSAHAAGGTSDGGSADVSTPGTPIFAVLHIADLFRDQRMILPSQLDWQKIARIRRGEWPKPIPPYHVATTENPGFVEDWFRQAESSEYVVLDTEYDRDSKYLFLVGLRARGVESSLLFDWRSDHEPWFRSRYIGLLRRLVSLIPAVFQNYLADGPVLDKNVGIKYVHFTQIEDTMQAHAVLWSEWPHELEFLQSIYGQYPKLKHLMAEDLYLYNHGDLLGAEDTWEQLKGELKADPLSENLYRSQNLRLLPTIHERDKKGIRVNQARVLPALTEYEGKLADASRLAKAWLGYPINVGSNQQISKYAYGVLGLPVQKHKETKKPTVDDDAIAILRGMLEAPPDLDEEEKSGLPIQAALERVGRGADPVLEARVVYMAAQQNKSHYIDPLFTWEYKGRGKSRKKHRRLGIVERIHPQQKIHAQASGRWSTTDPPLAQVPNDLLDIIYPDEGEVWIGWDWDQIELRLLAALANDSPLLKAFEEGWDIHTLNACDIFGLSYPPDLKDPHKSPACEEWRRRYQWEGKDDTRRVFAKRFVYRLNYGGDPRNAGDIPGAKALGLTPKGLITASHRYLAAHPALNVWRREIAAVATRNRLIRDFMGRRRRLLGDAKAAVREAYNHPMQAGVASIFNAVVVEVKETLPCLVWVYGRHDAQWWACPEDQRPHAWEVTGRIACKEWSVQGVKVKFPATFKQCCTVHKDCLKRERRAT